MVSFDVRAMSRSMVQVMQRAPPRPRPSSLPGMVMTSMPCLRSIVLVTSVVADIGPMVWGLRLAAA